MKILAFGGRDWDDRAKTYAALDAVHKKRGITLLIAGGQRGADTFAADWADSRSVDKKVVPARWKELGRAAGPIRNGEMMLLNPDAGVGFPGGIGTADMATKLINAGKKIWQPYG